MKTYPRLLFALCVIFAFSISASFSTDIKISKIGGGYQIWWEAEDFNERDPEEGYKLVTEASESDNRIKLTEGFYGTDATMFPGASNKDNLKDWWGLYRFNLPQDAKPGTWYCWCRISFVGVHGDLESHHLWVLNDPGDGNTIPKTRPQGQIDDADDRLFADVPGFDMAPPWTWHGRNLVMEGLDKELQAGSNVVMIWERESGFDSVYIDVMMFANDKAYMPKDQDYELSSLAVEPAGKLPLKWGQIKSD